MTPDELKRLAESALRAKQLTAAFERQKLRKWFSEQMYEARRIKNIQESGLFMPLIPITDTNKMLTDALARRPK